jgi:hypothetical protein
MFLVKRLQDAYRTGSPDEQATVRALFADAGLDPLLDVRPRRWVVRSDNREVWGPAQEPVLTA